MKDHRVIVIDQTLDGIDKDLSKYIHMLIKPHRNLGFAKGMNTGIRLADSKYVTCANDDIEFINDKWWKGIEEAFASDTYMGAVNPMSVKEPGWGYGLKEDIEHLPYKESYTEEEYKFLSSVKSGSIDGIATWCTTFRKDILDLKGYFDESFYPGGGEDYDIGGRFYDGDYPTVKTGRYRMVATSRSWVYHHWGKSVNGNNKGMSLPIIDELRSNSLSKLYTSPSGKDCFNGHPTKAIRQIREVNIVDL
jgi:GT2 family glycosyltransferase